MTGRKGKKNVKNKLSSFKKGGRNQKAELKGSVCRSKTPRLTPSQAEIYTYLQNEGLTVSQAAARKNCSKRYIRRIKNHLQKIGLLSLVPPIEIMRWGIGTSGTRNDKLKNRRLHAQKFRIELVRPVNENYLLTRIGKCIKVDGNNVQCFEKVILVQAKNKSFYGDTEDEALEESMVYWTRFFRRLEGDLSVMIIKNRKQNISMTFSEWATEDCELSRECEKKGDRIRIYAVDGKLRYTTDKSFKYEREAHHFRTGKEDSEIGNRFIEDILDHPEAPNFTELVKCVRVMGEENKKIGKTMGLLAEQNKETSACLNNVMRSMGLLAEQNTATATGLNGLINILKSKQTQKVKNNKGNDYFG